MRKISLLSLAALLLAPAAFAADLDAASSSALQQTTSMMADSALREEAIKGDEEAMKAAANVKKLAGGDKQKEEEMYRIANEMFAKIVKEENGDLDKVQARLDAYMKNPDSLGAGMTEAQKSAVRQLSSQ